MCTVSLSIQVIIWTQQAWIENECILLALEPEAATSWCKRKQEEIDPKGPLSKKDANIMVVDVGGGTVDISVSQKTEKGGIKLIQKPEGGAWGGTAVDKTFLRFLDEVFGQEAIEKLRDEALVEYYEILTTFEVQKRDSNIESLTLHVPTLIDITGEQNLMENINSLGFQNDVKILKKRGKRIRIGRNVIESCFRLPVKNIGSLICELLHKPHLKNIDIMLLVGGFANCQLLKDEITQKVGSITNMFVPRNPELAVLKGAVRYGMNPSSVRARKMNFSYGIGKPVPYDRLKHDASMVEFDRGTNIVTLFERFVEKDEEFKTGEVVSKSFVSAMGTDLTMIKVFTSSEKNPKYIKESGCKMIGNIVIEHDACSDDKDRMFNVQFEFGKTELSVRVAMQHTGKELCTRINCL
ncbi:heat shock 70 kDa protein 12A-like isoform X2 [Mya arenaria]|uniref:heat shock 70 kDa protein 12A-like isoform X2 n=1 Tax=Mya arenaria TaxID=6604 RepID=UPI0022E76C22|nr:heat shock 70 kDa protein 12A-like isoform X2 [Mya arenaria]